MASPSLTCEELAKRTAATYRQRYGMSPQWISAAPGRVNLIGEHTDYNDGFVLPLAIERYTIIAAGPRGDKASSHIAVVQAYSATKDEQVAFAIDDLVPGRQHGWSSYVAGVFAGFYDRGLVPGGLNLVVDGNLPLGGGLSSSAALEVATATVLEAVTGVRLAPLDKMLLCQQAEHDYAGVPCGIMDQFACVAGQRDRLLLLDCRSKRFELIPLTDPDVTVLIVNSKVRHELGNSEYARRRAQCHAAAEVLGATALRDATLEQLQQAAPDMASVLAQRARHVIYENERTVRAVEAIRSGHWDEVGRLMYASHASLRDDYEVSCRELDLLVDLAAGTDGVIGSRMTGGGFGGCTVSLVRSGAVEAVSQHLAQRYHAETGIKPAVFATRPAPGACLVLDQGNECRS